MVKHRGTAPSLGFAATDTLPNSGEICWGARLLRSHIVGGVEIFDGVGLAAGLFIAVGLDYSGEILAALLAFSMLWVSLRDTRALRRIEAGTRVAVIAGAVFLVVTPSDSHVFYFVLPQPDSTLVATVLYISRNLAVAFLVGGVASSRINAESLPSA